MYRGQSLDDRLSLTILAISRVCTGHHQRKFIYTDSLSVAAAVAVVGHVQELPLHGSLLTADVPRHGSHMRHRAWYILQRSRQHIATIRLGVQGAVMQAHMMKHEVSCDMQDDVQQSTVGGQRGWCGS